MNAWILCPNLWGARLFSTDNLGETPHFLRELPRLKTLLRHEDFDTDEDVPEPTEELRIAERFMARISRFLEAEGRRDSFDALIVCAEARLLGILRAKLGRCARSRLIGTVEEDLYEVNESDLASYLRPFQGARSGRSAA